MVLATDMSCHFGLIKQMKALLTTPDRYGTALVLYSLHYKIYCTIFTSISLHTYCSCTKLANQKRQTEAEAVEVGERETAFLVHPMYCTVYSVHYPRHVRSIDKSRALSFILHAADISHPAKRWDVHRQWTDRLVEEFFRQGDREKELGLTVSPLCDRNNTAVPDSQVGFINFIVSPTMQLVAEMVERVTVQQIRSALPPTTYGLTREYRCRKLLGSCIARAIRPPTAAPVLLRLNHTARLAAAVRGLWTQSS